jgi:hypothetical protein
MHDDRTDFLHDDYRLLTDDIRRNEAIIPPVCGLEIVVMVFFLVVYWWHGPEYLATILVLLTNTWAMHLLVNANFWSRRSSLMAANVEEVFLSPDDMDVLIPRWYYSDARVYRYRRVFRWPMILSATLFLTSLACTPQVLSLKSLSLVGVGGLLLLSVYVENYNCSREYSFLVDHAPGPRLGVAK